jgi:hypothetical protein
MKTDSEPELKKELKYLTVKNNYSDQELTFAVNFKNKLLWYVDKQKNLISLEFERFFDNNNNFIQD